jgi:hypothetical protein
MLETWTSRKEVQPVEFRGNRQFRLSEQWRKNFLVGSIPSEMGEADHHAIQGTVFRCDGKGLSGVLVMTILRDDNGRRSIVGKAITGANGHYQIFPIFHSDQAMTCCFFRDGYEPQFRATEPVNLNDQGEVNAILPPARAIAMHLVSEGGLPIDGVQLSIASSATDPFPFTYTSDFSGMVYTQAILRVGREYWVRVLTGGLELHAQWFETPEPGGSLSADTANNFGAKIQVKNVGRFTELPEEMRLSEIGFSINDCSSTATDLWGAHSQSPWLPSGRGVFCMFRHGLPDQLFRVEVPNGIGAWDEQKHVIEKIMASD